MRIGAAVLASTLLLAPPLHAGEKTDVIVITNGDHLTCEIKQLSSGALYVSLDYVDGTIELEWSKIARLQSTRLFIVEMLDGSVYTGTLTIAEAPPGEPPRLRITGEAGNAVVVESGRINKLSQTSDKFLHRFNGNINSGISYSKGNQTTQYNLNGIVQYPRPRWTAQLTFNSSLSASTGSDISTRNQLGFGANRLLRFHNYFYAGFASGLQSAEQGINLQTNLGGGIGRYLKKTNRITFSVLAGLAWQLTRYNQSTSSQPTENILVAALGGTFYMYQFNKTNLTLTANALPALTQSGRLFYNANATYYLKLFGNLTWNFSAYGNWDTKPPSGFSGSDYGVTSGLGWSFGVW